MKKILCLVPYTFLPAKTGGQKSIASFYQNLSQHFILICIGTERNDTGKSRYKMLNILSNSSLRYIDPFNFFRIRDVIRREKPNYFELEHPYLGWLAILLKKSTGIKLIVRSHNIEGLRFKNLGKWWWKILIGYEGWVHRNADINYFISDVDRLYAIKTFKLLSQTSYTITFGINRTAPPTREERNTAKSFLVKEHQLNISDTLILFNGAFDYRPNANALSNLLQHIFPLLEKLSLKTYKLIVCGKDIPKGLIEVNTNNNIIFAGFVPDINPYLKGTSIFVNPITEGGGIKTKLVEALGFNLNCVSYKTGAIGVTPEVCGEKLIIIPDDNTEKFAKAILTATQLIADIPDVFYKKYANEKIMEKIKGIL